MAHTAKEMEPDDPTSTAPHADRSTDERTTTTSDSATRQEAPATISDRYAALSLTDGKGLIYDLRDPSVWIQSDVVRSLDRMV